MCLNKKDAFGRKTFGKVVTAPFYGAGHIAGNSTLDDIVFGKIAGKKAAGK